MVGMATIPAEQEHVLEPVPVSRSAPVNVKPPIAAFSITTPAHQSDPESAPEPFTARLRRQNTVSQDPRMVFWMNTRKRVRFVTVLNLAIVVAFIYWDFAYYPAVFTELLITRGALLFVGSIFIAITYLYANFWRYSEVWVAIGYLLTGLDLVVVRVLTDQNEPSEGVMTFMIIVFTCIGLRFYIAAAVCTSTIIAFVIAHTVFMSFKVNQVIGSVMMLVMGFAMGAAGSYYDTIWSQNLFDHRKVKTMRRFTTVVPNMEEVINTWRSGIKLRLDFPNVSIERHYQHEFGRVSQNKRRLASLLSIATQGVLSLLDWLFGNTNYVSTIIRFSVVVPFAALAFTLTFTRMRKVLNFGLVASILVFSSTTLAVTISQVFFENNSELTLYRLIRFLIVLFFGYIFSSIPYSFAFATGLVSAVLYVVVFAIAGVSPGLTVILFLAVAMAIGTFTAYNMEKGTRIAFLSSAPSRYIASPASADLSDVTRSGSDSVEFDADGADGVVLKKMGQ